MRPSPENRLLSRSAPRSDTARRLCGQLPSKSVVLMVRARWPDSDSLLRTLVDHLALNMSIAFTRSDGWFEPSTHWVPRPCVGRQRLKRQRSRGPNRRPGVIHQGVSSRDPLLLVAAFGLAHEADRLLTGAGE
jgi:hypothetical protein